MALDFNETFEGDEYDNVWNDNPGAGCTIDGNADPADVGSPSGWGSECLKIIHNSNANYSYSQFGDGDVRYTKVEIVVTSLGDISDNGDKFYICGATNNALGGACWYLAVERSGGVNRFVLEALLDGAATTDHWSDDAVVVDQLYIIEIEWDSSGNNNFEWRIDGVMQDQGNLTAGHVNHGTAFTGGTTGNSTGTFYLDLFQVDDSDWIYTLPSSNAPTGVFYGPLVGSLGGPI